MSRTVVVSGGNSGLTQKILVGPYLFRSDEPVDAGVDDSPPSPYELLLAALGACTGMTLRAYADRHQWPLEGVQVWLEHSRVDVEGSDAGESTKPRDRIERGISFVGELSEVQRQTLVKVANGCSLHRTLTSGVQIDTSVIQQGTGATDLATAKGAD